MACRLALGTNPDPDEPLGLQRFEEVGMLALATGHDGRQDHQPGVFRQGEDGVDHLRDSLGLQRLLRVIRAVGRAGAGIQQPQVVVDLGHRADRRARVVTGGLLLDRDRRRQPLDQVDVRLFHQLQKLPGIGRQRLDIPALALGIERVEGERRLARAGQAGDHHQPIARQVERDVLQIVGAGAADTDRCRVGNTTFSGGVQVRVPGPRLCLRVHADRV